MKHRFDMHIHSSCSSDSKVPLREMCLCALQKGLSAICFSEHCDFNPLDSGCLFYNHDRCTKEIESARKEFGSRLEILQGIEFSEPHKYPKEFEVTIEKLDFVLASVHWVGDTLVGDKRFTSTHSREQVFDLYYHEVIEAIRLGGFDSLAHIDQPKRYIGNCAAASQMANSICGELAKRGICLELNSSLLRKGMNEIYPSDGILKFYKDHGGKNVTFGSDAHDGEDISSDFEVLAEKSSRFGLNAVVFRRRQAYVAGAG